MGERDVLLQERRPAAAGGVAHLLAARIERHAHAPRRARQPRGESDVRVQALERVPFQLDADELPLRAACLLRREGLSPNEAVLGQIDGPREVQLEGRRELAVDQRLARGDVIDVDQHQTRFDARDVERQHAGGHDAVRAAGIDERIPDRQSLGGIEPDFEAKVAGVSRARDLDRDAAQAGARHAEVLERRRAERLQDGPGGRALQRERGNALRNIGDLHLESCGVVLEPAQIRLGRGHAEAVLIQARHGAVVDHLAGVIAPGRVKHLASLCLEHVARHDQVEEPRGVAPAHEIFVERRDIEQGGRRADDVVFALVRELVGARDEVPRPAPPGMARAERGGALVERRRLQHQSMRAPLSASK